MCIVIRLLWILIMSFIYFVLVVYLIGCLCALLRAVYELRMMIKVGESIDYITMVVLVIFWPKWLMYRLVNRGM